MLPHLLQSTTYANFYTNVPGYKILDNGEAEDMRIQPDALMMCAREIGAQEVVIPDKIADCNGTLQLLREFKPYAIKNSDLKFMGVLQGLDYQEVFRCLNGFLASDIVDTIGIPRHFVDRFHREARYNIAAIVAERAEANGTPVEIHCLGSGSFIKEPVLLSELLCLRGIDTSLPVYMGLNNVDIKKGAKYERRPDDYFDRTAERGSVEYKWIEHNVETYLGWCN